MKPSEYDILQSLILAILGEATWDGYNVQGLMKIHKTSRYQIKKIIDGLKAKGIVELAMIQEQDEFQSYPPYWYYRITDIYKQTSVYQEMEASLKRTLRQMCHPVEIG